jgi:hypothetical protein
MYVIYCWKMYFSCSRDCVEFELRRKCAPDSRRLCRSRFTFSHPLLDIMDRDADVKMEEHQRDPCDVDRAGDDRGDRADRDHDRDRDDHSSRRDRDRSRERSAYWQLVPI